MIQGSGCMVLGDRGPELGIQASVGLRGIGV